MRYAINSLSTFEMHRVIIEMIFLAIPSFLITVLNRVKDGVLFS